VPPPEWIGELYLELHQGTLTSQATIKKQNRQCEISLCALDALYVWCVVCVAKGDVIVGEQERVYLNSLKDLLTALWKDLLLNQFHDVLRKFSSLFPPPSFIFLMIASLISVALMSSFYQSWIQY
jgi:alpha-mannosidase